MKIFRVNLESENATYSAYVVAKDFNEVVSKIENHYSHLNGTDTMPWISFVEVLTGNPNLLDVFIE